MSDLRFEVDDLTRPVVHRLLEEHLGDMRATSPAESIHALGVEALRAPGVTFWTAWSDRELHGCGALRDLGGGEGELKSMRTAGHARGRGVGATILDFLIAQARRRSYHHVRLETGTQEYFAPARRLYARHGFVTCPPFDAYTADANSVFMVLSLDGFGPNPI